MSYPVRIEFDVGGIEEFRSKMMRLDQGVRMHVWEKLQEVGDKIKHMARMNAPVRTGWLRHTIYSKMEPPNPLGMTEKWWVLKVGAWASYAGFQEFGTRYIKAQKFLRGALEFYLPQFAQVVAQALRLAAEEAAR